MDTNQCQCAKAEELPRHNWGRGREGGCIRIRNIEAEWTRGRRRENIMEAEYIKNL